MGGVEGYVTQQGDSGHSALLYQMLRIFIDKVGGEVDVGSVGGCFEKK